MEMQIQRKNEIREAVFRTIAFFDLFDYPLTEYDLWQYLPTRCKLEEMQAALLEERILTASFINRKQGHYYLSGREELIETKTKRYNYTNQKFIRAIRVVRLFSFIPWIKMIAVGNIIGTNNLKKGGDIDLFVITKRKRLWLSRFFCVIIIKLLNLRPQERNIKDKICLSFFISEDKLNIKEFMLDNKDIYFIHWLAGLVSIYDRARVYDKFIKANSWIKDHLPNWQSYIALDKRLVKSWSNGLYAEIVELLLGGLEKAIRDWQIGLLPARIKEVMNKNAAIIVNEQVIKLHVNDRREKIYQRYLNKLGLIGYD